MRWPWTRRRRRDAVADEETRAARAEVERRDPRVRALSAELNAAKRRNHFSIMVSDAIRRAREV